MKLTGKFNEKEVFEEIKRIQSYAIAKEKKVGCVVYGRNSVMVEGFFGGVNIEISSSDVIHAERMALMDCLSQRFYPEIIFVTSGRTDGKPTFLCGNCRQLLSEINEECLIVIFDPKGKVKGKKKLNQVFPYHKDSTKKNVKFREMCQKETCF